MVIDEIYSIGQAISILMSGYIENDNLVSLKGTLVPATTIIIQPRYYTWRYLIGKKLGRSIWSKF